jgi:hypothetical protein
MGRVQCDSPALEFGLERTGILGGAEMRWGRAEEGSRGGK